MSVQIKYSKKEAVNLRRDDELSFLPQGTGDDELDQTIELAGYAYDPIQDIFVSTMNPWQRKVGYCRLYDEAAAPMGMIIDTEPIYFDYQDKKWMIGLWKGQYDLVTGGEIGIYTGALNLNIPGTFNGTFYSSASDTERLQMSFTLKKKGHTLFTRAEKHWWLTGFKLGEFSEPSELAMEIKINFTELEMRDAFVSGLKNAGYSDDDVTIRGNEVSFLFATPHTPQPLTRTAEIGRITQRKNKFMCDKYQEITGPYLTFPEKIQALKEQEPELYKKAFKIGKSKQFYDFFIVALITGTLLVSLLIGCKKSRKG